MGWNILHLVEIDHIVIYTCYNIYTLSNLQKFTKTYLINRTTILSDIMVDLPVLESSPLANGLIFSTAIFHEMDYLLTVNVKDFKDLYRKTIGKTTILKPREFLYRL